MTIPVNNNKTNWVDIFAVVLLLVQVSIIIIGTRPLSGPFEGGAEDSSSNLLRQIPLLLTILLSMAYLVPKKGYRALAEIPLPFWLFFIWALITLSWSVVPDIGARRLFLTFGTTISLAALSRRIGHKRTIVAISWLVLVFMLVDLASVATLTNAIHQPGESDRELVGLWKGVHSHKNLASTVAFFGTIFGITEFIYQKNRRSLIILTTSAIMLVGSGSKTSVLLLLPCSLITIAVWLLARAHSGKVLLKISIVLGCAALALFTVYFWDDIYPTITSGNFLTGRGYLWRISIRYSLDHPLGAGFGSFWDVGYNSPAFQYGPEIYAAAPHGHNGYLDTLAATGWFGLFLATLSCIAWPMYKILFSRMPSESFFVFAISYTAYFIVQNVTEPSIFSGTRPEWLFFVVNILYLQSHAKQQHPLQVTTPLFHFNTAVSYSDGNPPR